LCCFACDFISAFADLKTNLAKKSSFGFRNQMLPKIHRPGIANGNAVVLYSIIIFSKALSRGYSIRRLIM